MGKEKALGRWFDDFIEGKAEEAIEYAKKQDFNLWRIVEKHDGYCRYYAGESLPKHVQYRALKGRIRVFLIYGEQEEQENG